METMRDVAEAAVASGVIDKQNGGEFDYALPQGWWDAFYALVGEPPLGFVWYYPPRGVAGHIFGVPLPLTDGARAQLVRYETAR